jgi:transcriptional regulator with XRE-family HTH domain
VAASIPALVEPSVLRWARESIDLTQVAAARKIGVPDDRVEQWENGEAQPTIAQLRKAATVYKRALAVFFLPVPPVDFDTLRDFRRVAEAEEGAWSPALHADYRRAHEQREHALELFEIEDVTPPSGWRLESLPSDDEQIAGAARKRLLGLSPLSLPRGAGTVYDHLNVWVAGLEAAGVLVLATARGQVKTEEMRGFSLYFDQVPVIVVNGADAPRGRLFTLVHEYAHLMLHTEGLCDTLTDLRAVTPDRRLEAQCNALAASHSEPTTSWAPQAGRSGQAVPAHLGSGGSTCARRSSTSPCPTARGCTVAIPRPGQSAPVPQCTSSAQTVHKRASQAPSRHRTTSHVSAGQRRRTLLTTRWTERLLKKYKVCHGAPGRSL